MVLIAFLLDLVMLGELEEPARIGGRVPYRGRGGIMP